MNLLEHAKDCTPLTPCAACELVAFLRDNIEPNIFDGLLERAKKLQPAADGQARRDPLPVTAPINLLRTLQPLSRRTTNAMRLAFNCETIDDVLKRGRVEWSTLPNFGRRSLTELEQALALAGYQLPEETA